MRWPARQEPSDCLNYKIFLIILKLYHIFHEILRDLIIVPEAELPSGIRNRVVTDDGQTFIGIAQTILPEENLYR